MAKIPTYETPALDLRPSETGIDALQQAARRTGAFYGQAAEDYSQIGQRTASALREGMQVALTAEEHRETTAGAKNFATLVANKTEQWNKLAATADPNDPAVKQKFLDSMEGDLDNFTSNGFLTENGQKFAQAHVAQFRQHMFEKTTADMSRLAGEAAHANTRETINQLSNTAYNDSSSLDFAINTLKSSVNGIVSSSPNLGANAGAVRTTILEDGTEKIVKSAAIGAITRTGQVPAWVTDPKYSKYVNGAELEQFRKAAEAQTRANLYYQKQTALLDKQQADLQVHKNATDLFANSVSVDPNNPERVLVAPDFMKRALDIARKNPDAPSAAATVKTLVDWAESQHSREAKITDDPAVRQDLFSRMGATDNPTTEIQILRADANHQLSAATRGEFLRLQKAIQERPEGESIKHTRDNFNKSFDRLIDGMMNERGEHSLLGAQRTFEFQMAARRQEAELIKQGKDPGLVYDPRPENPYYFGRLENIASYRVTAKQAMDYEKTLKTQDAARSRAAPPSPAPTAAPAPATEPATGFAPPSNWQWNPARRQYRDPDGKLYDARGHPLPSAIVPQSR